MIEKLEKMIENGLNLEEAFQIISWKEFEESVAEIFEKHNFKVKRNFIFKTSKKYQIDLIAERGELIVIVDCKQWGKHRYKTSALKKAALKQNERKEELKKLLGNGKKILPIIVTLNDENFYDFEKVFIVPLFKLNNFLNEIHQFL